MRAGDPWCSLCHLPVGTPVLAAEPAAPVAEPAAPVAELAAPAAVPHQRSAPPPGPGVRPRRLVGGTVPDAVLASFEAGLADLSRSDGRATGPTDDSRGVRVLLDRLRGRPAMAATVGAIVVLVGLLIGMTAVGLVI